MSEGYRKFLCYVGELRRASLTQAARRYAEINTGYRRMVARQAELTPEEAQLPLDRLSGAQRRALYQANRCIAELAEQAHRVLLTTLIPDEE